MKRVKKENNESAVTLHIGLIRLKDEELKVIRGSTLPLKVLPSIGAEELLRKGAEFRSRFYLSSKSKFTLYYSLIYPYITYCNSTWSSTYVTNLNRIYCLQKRTVRALTNSDYRANSAPLFSKLKILDTYQLNVSNRYFKIS